MWKKRHFIIFFVAIVLIVVGVIQKHSIVFLYNNPNVETSGIQKISSVIKWLDNGF